MKSEVLKRINEKQALIGVIGLGYVGLPLILRFGEVGFRVLGYDVDPEKVAANNRGESYIKHIPSEGIRKLLDKNLYEATTEAERLREPDAILICVPTPLNKNKAPNLEYVVKTTEVISEHLRPGQIVILESTTYPGTTDEIMLPILSGSGLEAGKDFFLAYSPEREDPGNPKFNTRTIPKVVGGLTPACKEIATTIYEKIIDKVVPVSTTRAAEMTKLLENIYRSVNIAMVNELKILADKMGIDLWEVIDAAATKPFGFQAFYPGPGLGGHCIPIDPFYLAWKAKEYDTPTRFIELSGEVNSAMPDYVISQVSDKLNSVKRSINGSSILVIGIAYKKDVDDLRESPALVIIDKLLKHGAEVRYHDQFIPVIPQLREFSFDMQSTPLTPETIRAADLVLIVTDHSTVDYKSIAENADLILDTRNAMRKYGAI